jgi:mannan endo-1,4-beta-mannosidase
MAGTGLKNGVNLQPSYYSGGNVDLGWALMRQKPKIQSVRIEIEPGQEENASRWIKEAADNGYTIVATFHNSASLGSDDPAELLKAAEWWAANYTNLRVSGDFVINLMNEWGSHEITPHDFAVSYNKAIAAARTAYDGLIIIDIPGWGQEVHTAACAIT